MTPVSAFEQVLKNDGAVFFKPHFSDCVLNRNNISKNHSTPHHLKSVQMADCSIKIIQFTGFSNICVKMPVYLTTKDTKRIQHKGHEEIVFFVAFV